MEIWKDIVGWENYYEVSNKGRIRSKDRVNITKAGNESFYKGQIRTPVLDQKGYLRVTLKARSINRKETIKVHRAVAQAFIPNPENKSQVNHINEIKTDNSVENLEWVTNYENAIHGTRTQRATQSRKKPVLQFTRDNVFVAEYESPVDASRITGISSSGISGVCRKEKNRKSAGGFVWYYKEE